jgi:Uncharacterised ACR, YggU family COG1872
MPDVSCTLAIAVVPNAPRSEIVGWLGAAVKIKVHAPPVEDKANLVLCEFLADRLGVPRGELAPRRHLPPQGGPRRRPHRFGGAFPARARMTAFALTC